MCSIDCAISSVVAAKQGALASRIATSVAAKQLDAAQQQGDAIVQMLNDVANMVKQQGKGERIDVQA